MALFPRTAIVLVLVFALSGGSVSGAFAQATSTPGAATATPVACVNTSNSVQIVLENPQPGDTLISGTPVQISGIAFDPRSAGGSGVSSVMVYLGSRDAGGTALGTAILGQPNPQVPTNSPFANAGFTLRTPNLPNGNGGRSIFVYAHSIVDNSEGVLEVPIFLNTAPTPVRGQVPTAVLPTPPACTPTPAPTATTAPTDTPLPVLAVSTSTPTPRPTSTLPPVPTPLPPAPAPVAPAAPAPAPPAAPAAAAPAPIAVSPASAQTAPRGGGMPTAVGLIVIAFGASIVALGVGVRRRH